MHYDFDDLEHQDHLAPSDIRPPMNYANGGLVTAPFTNVMNTQNQMNLMSRPTGSFSGMSSQLNTNPPPASLAQKQPSQGLPQYQPRSYQPTGMPAISTPVPASTPPQTSLRMNPYDQGAELSQKQPENFPAQPFQAQPINQPMFQQPQPPVVQVDETQQQAPLAMAKGGAVGTGPERLIAQIRKKFAEQGIDFDKIMAMRLQHMGQKGDTMLAHINPDEAKLLKEHGGSGKKNPHTGLLSFGVDDGPEAGSTGSASGASYGGSSSVGSGGGSNQSANAAMGSESPAQRDVSYTGGGGSNRDASDAANSASARQQAERAQAEQAARDKSAADAAAANAAARQQAERAQAEQAARDKAAADAAAANAARIAAERASMQNYNNIMATSPSQLMSDKMRQSALNLSNANQEIIQAQKNEAARVKNYETLKSLGALQDTRPTEYEMSSIMSSKPATITGFESPTGATTTFNSSSSGIVPTGIFQKDEKSAFQSVVDSITAEAIAPLAITKELQKAASIPSAPTASPYGYTPPSATPTAQSVLPAAPTATNASIYNYTPPAAPLTTVNPMSPAQIRAAQEKSMSNLAAAQATAPAKATFDEYGAGDQAPVPVPIPVPGRVPVDETVPVEETIPVPPVSSRFPAVPPMPPIPYRDLGEGNILDMLLKPFGLDTESWINNKAAEYEKQGLTPSDAAIRASYDLRDLQQSQKDRAESRGGNNVTPPPPLSKPKKPVKKPPEEEQKEQKPFRTFYQPNIDYSTYGLGGGEASFYKAKGGAVSPLKAVKKHG